MCLLLVGAQPHYPSKPRHSESEKKRRERKKKLKRGVESNGEGKEEVKFNISKHRWRRKKV